MSKTNITFPLLEGKFTLTNILSNQSEEYYFQNINKNKHSYFHIVWLKELSKLLKTIGNQKIRVFCYIIDNIDTNNKLITSIRKMARELDMSTKTVSVALHSLKKLDYIVQIQDGAYMLSPRLLLQGKAPKKRRLLKEYYGFVEDIEKVVNNDLEELLPEEVS